MGKAKSGESFRWEKTIGLNQKDWGGMFKKGRDVLDNKTPGSYETSRTEVDMFGLTESRGEVIPEFDAGRLKVKGRVMDGVKLLGSINNTSNRYVSQT